MVLVSINQGWLYLMQTGIDLDDDHEASWQFVLLSTVCYWDTFSLLSRPFQPAFVNTFVRAANVSLRCYCYTEWLNYVAIKTKGSKCSVWKWKKHGLAFCLFTAMLNDLRCPGADQCIVLNVALQCSKSFSLFVFLLSSFHAGVWPGDLSEPNRQHSHCTA